MAKNKNKISKTITKIHNFREQKEDELANLLDKIGNNSTYKKFKNDGADKLVGLGIELGIKYAEAQFGLDIPDDPETIKKFADIGGDKAVGLWDWFWDIVKKVLRRK